jgi:hypothetical protein
MAIKGVLADIEAGTEVLAGDNALSAAVHPPVGCSTVVVDVAVISAYGAGAVLTKTYGGKSAQLDQNKGDALVDEAEYIFQSKETKDKPFNLIFSVDVTIVKLLVTHELD